MSCTLSLSPPLLLRLPSVARASLSLRGSLSCLAGRTGPNGGRSGAGKEARWRLDHPGTVRKCRWKGKRRSGCDVTRQISCVRLWHSVPERVSRLIVFLPLSMPETWRSGWHPPPTPPQPFSTHSHHLSPSPPAFLHLLAPVAPRPPQPPWPHPSLRVSLPAPSSGRERVLCRGPRVRGVVSNPSTDVASLDGGVKWPLKTG